MKTCFTFLIFFLLLNNTALSVSDDLTNADGLPFESDLTKIKLNKISTGRDLKLKFNLSIPNTQKINEGAPSQVSVYEKNKNAKIWSLTKKISLKNTASFIFDRGLTENISLKSDDSEVAVHATIYHCGKKDTRIPCFIQGFQGIARRDPKLKNKLTIPFNVKGFVY